MSANIGCTAGRTRTAKVVVLYGVERRGLEIAEHGRVELQPLRTKLVGEPLGLVRHPHALGSQSRCGKAGESTGRQRVSLCFHSDHPLDSPARLSRMSHERNVTLYPSPRRG